MESFRKLGFCEEILRVLKELKFEKPSEIQEKTVPLVVAGKDVIACAATGSGKTLAFGSGIIQNVVAGKGVQALVLTPTRELAQQVGDSLRMFSKYKGLNVCEVYGGVSYNPQISAIKNSEVVVGTPGRILDHLSQNTLSLDKISILVLDEADRMLDMGFVRDIKKIIAQCKKTRQTLLFSATINSEIVGISKEFMKDAIEISAEKNVDPKKLKQIYYDVPDFNKFSLLAHLIKNDPSKLVMVFCNTKRNADFIAYNLKKNGVRALAIHGGHSQNRRTDTMDQFKEMSFQVLVCTDVAARGLDIKNVSHVYNYDSPADSSQYVHRIGRTARAGKEGIAITILGSRDYENFGKIIREHPEIERLDVPIFEKAIMERKDRVSVGRIDGRDRFSGRRDARRGFSRGSRRETNRRDDSRGRFSRADSYREDSGSYDGRENRRGQDSRGRGISRGRKSSTKSFSRGRDEGRSFSRDRDSDSRGNRRVSRRNDSTRPARRRY
ncbi:MAG: DEAD/DEAH box helicase [Bacteroidales bacterium]|jgi:ATP-dependent RNA helicase DeaD|nr:DEAD/DEAH box helicase [Bacteroidales bacterium]